MNHSFDRSVHNAPTQEPGPCDRQPIKRCPTCGVWKTPDCFHKCISEESKDGLYFECMACVAKREGDG